MPAIEKQDSRIEFGQLRDVNESPTQLTFDLENTSQTTLFDTSFDKYLEVPIDKVFETVLFENKDLEETQNKQKDQISIKSFGAYPDSDSDQLWLHYTDNDSYGFDEETGEEEEVGNASSIPFHKSALYSRRRNRFRAR